MLFSEISDEARAHSMIKHEGHLSHELIVGAASYEAAKAYNDHLESRGGHVSHQRAKELLAGFTGGYIDHLFETRGLDAFDRERAKRAAQTNVEAALAKSSAY